MHLPRLISCILFKEDEAIAEVQWKLNGLQMNEWICFLFICQVGAFSMQHFNYEVAYINVFLSVFLPFLFFKGEHSLKLLVGNSNSKEGECGISHRCLQSKECCLLWHVSSGKTLACNVPATAEVEAPPIEINVNRTRTSNVDMLVLSLFPKYCCIWALYLNNKPCIFNELWLNFRAPRYHKMRSSFAEE